MPGRSPGNTAYPYRHNGQERNNSIFEGALSAEFWMYDSRTGRRWNTDPIRYPWQSPYATFNGNPILYTDPDGLEGTDYVKDKKTGVTFYDPDVKGQGDVDRLHNNGDPSERYSYAGEEVRGAKDISGQTFDGLKGGYKFIVLKEVEVYSGSGKNNFSAQNFGLDFQKRSLYFDRNKDKNGWLKYEQKFFFPASGRLDLSPSPLDLWLPGSSGTTVYRSMSDEAAEIFLKTGKMPAGTETFFSLTKSFAQNYEGTLFEISVNPTTMSQLEAIGVRNTAASHPFEHLPLVGKGWKETNAFFKVEGNQVNIGLGNGKALEIFNSNIQSFNKVK